MILKIIGAVLVYWIVASIVVLAAIFALISFAHGFGTIKTLELIIAAMAIGWPLAVYYNACRTK